MPTPNYGWILPSPGASAGVWGTLLNEVFDDASPAGVDQVVKAVSDVANAAMPKAGGTFTGAVENLDDQYALVNKGSISGAQTLDLDTANFFYATIAGATTFTFSNPAASGKVTFFTLELTNGAAGAITWPASVNWPGGSAPALSSAVDVLTFYTRDNGTTWRGALAMSASQ